MGRSGTCFKIALSAVTATGLLLATPISAWAYIDPGSGSLAYQALLAGALATTFVFRSVLGRLKKWFDRDRP